MFGVVPYTMQPYYDTSSPMNLFAIPSQPFLPPMPPPSMQYSSQGVLHNSVPPIMDYSQRNFSVGPEMVSSQPVEVLQGPYSVTFCEAPHVATHYTGGYAHPMANNVTQDMQQKGQYSNHPQQRSQTSTLQSTHSSMRQVTMRQSNSTFIRKSPNTPHTGFLNVPQEVLPMHHQQQNVDRSRPQATAYQPHYMHEPSSNQTERPAYTVPQNTNNKLLSPKHQQPSRFRQGRGRTSKKHFEEKPRND